MFSYILVEAVLIILYIFNKVDFSEITLQVAVINIIACSFFIIAWLAVTCMYSGSPYSNSEYEIKVKVLSTAVLIWSAIKLIRGIVGTVQDWSLIERI